MKLESRTCHRPGEEHAALFVEQRHIQGPAPEVDHQDIEHIHFVQAVGHGCSCGLIDDAQDFQTWKVE